MREGHGNYEMRASRNNQEGVNVRMLFLLCVRKRRSMRKQRELKRTRNRGLNRGMDEVWMKLIENVRLSNDIPLMAPFVIFG